MSDLLKIASTQCFKALEEVDDDFIYIEGMASTIDKDRDGEIVAISGMDITNYQKNPIVLFSHDHQQPVGKVLEIEKRDNGLWIKAAISKAADKVVTFIQQGILKTFSIGFSVKDYSWSNTLEAWILEKSELFECSIVPVPANGAAVFEQVKSFGEQHKFEKPKSTKQNVQTTNKEIDMTLEEMEKQMKEMEEKLKAEETIKAKLLKEKAEKEAKEKAEKEAKEKEALKIEIKSVDEKVTKVTDLIETITESLKSITEEIETLKTAKPRVEGIAASEETIKHFTEDYKDALVASMIFNKDFKDTKKFQSMPERSKAISIDSAFLTNIQNVFLEDIKNNAKFYSLFREIPHVSNTDTVPYTAGQTSAWGSVSHSSWATDPIAVPAYTLFSSAQFNYVTDEEAIIPWLPILRADIVEALADGVDSQIIDDDATHTGTFAGIADWANGASNVKELATDQKLVLADVDGARAQMGKYGIDPRDLVLALSPDLYYDIIDEANVSTVDKFGPEATILTGQLPKIRGIDVMVHDHVPFANTASLALATIFNKKMWICKMSNPMVELDKTITTQTMTIVGSVRVGFMPSKPLDTGEIDGGFAYNLINAAA